MINFRKIIVTAALSLALLTSVSAQGLKGKVKNKNNEPLIGATIYWDGTTIGALTDEKGFFTVNKVKDYNKLITSYVGHQNDTTIVKDGMQDITITLDNSDLAVDDVIIESNQRGNYTAIGGTSKIEVISFSGLCKMACCSLAESFENSAAVTVGYSDAISGAKQIKMLGLAGTYTQILDESRTIMRGISAPYSLSYTPGMWLKSIQVSKGITSVTAGPEAITGQINLSPRQPTDPEKLFINGFINPELRTELNVSSSIPLTSDSRLSTVIMAHVSSDARIGIMDSNSDGFMDTPMTDMINISNRWVYSANNGMQIRWGFKALQENRLSGMMDYEKSMKDDMYEDDIYGSEIRNKAFNTYLKIGKPVGKSIYDSVNDEENQNNFAMVVDYDHFTEDAYFGLNDYFGSQNIVSFNLMYNHYFSGKSSAFFGVNTVLQSINESLHNDVPTMDRDLKYDLDREENSIGLYGEYTLDLDDKFSFIAGLRGDYNSYYNKTYITPRGQIKWNITPTSALRASVGMGYRSTNVITDNIGILATGRQIILPDDFDNFDRMERAITYGASYTQEFSVFKEKDITFSVDYFHTNFYNQVYADQEYNSTEVVVYSTDEKSYTDSFQADITWVPSKRVEIFATYRYTDAKMTLSRADGSTYFTDRPLVSSYKTLLNVQYKTNLNIWTFDVTAQFNGPSRIPTMTGYLVDSEYSEAYPMYYAQVTRKLGRFEIYTGCENIADYTQETPILGADSPFSTTFNSSVIYAPLMGRKFYLGFRFNLY